MKKLVLAVLIGFQCSFSFAQTNEVVVKAASSKNIKDADVYTLYSTNYPQSRGRSGVATFDLSSEAFNRAMCEDAADLYSADFERLKASSKYDGTTKMRYWCEKGRFRP